MPKDGSISLEARVDKNRIKIGDLVRFSIIITRDKNVNVQMPELGASLGAFEIRDYVDPAEQKIDGQVLQTREYTISTYDIGEYEIPPVRIFYTVGADTGLHELSTEKMTITVESVKPSEAGDIRDIKNPLEIPRDWWQIMRLALAGLLILLVVILGIMYYRRWKQGKSIIPKKEKPKRPPHEIALEELNELIRSDMLARGEVKQFYISISEIIRRYIGDRYYIVAIEMTTAQLVDAMNQADIENETTELVERFLMQCDLVKFAKYIPTDAETESVIHQAFDIVEKTTIVLVREESKTDAPDAVPAEPAAPVEAGQEVA